MPREESHTTSTEAQPPTQQQAIDPIKDKATTPINVDRVEQELQGHPNQVFVQSLVTGLREGFHIGYKGPEKSRVSQNLKSAQENPDMADKYLDKETLLGQVGGAFENPPFPNMQCHPIGVIPKKDPGKWHAILHLSYPDGDSINFHIPKDEYSLHYVTVDKAISIIKQLGPGTLLGKVDIEEAFRIIPVHPDDWHLLGMHWVGQYYYDKRLSMGGRSSPYIFDQLPIALEWICRNKYLIQFLLHLLDDFLAVEDPSSTPRALQLIIALFKYLGVPLAPHKVVGPTQCLEFLGIILDTVTMEARLSQEKQQKLLALLDSFANWRKCTKRELLSLIGSLSFATKVVAPGRTFLSRMIKLSCTVSSLNHLVYLNQSVREDIHMWRTFISQWNGKSVFLDRYLTAAPDLELFTDASGALGYGAYLQGHWFRGELGTRAGFEPSNRYLHCLARIVCHSVNCSGLGTPVRPEVPSVLL